MLFDVVGRLGAATETTDRTPGDCRAAAMTAAPPHECPIRMSAGVARLAMNSQALTMSSTLTVTSPVTPVPFGRTEAQRVEAQHADTVGCQLLA